MVRALVKAGAKREARDRAGMTPLHLAAKHDRSRIVEALLIAGADASARTKQGELAVDLVPESSKLEGTDVYWQLNQARFE